MVIFRRYDYITVVSIKDSSAMKKNTLIILSLAVIAMAVLASAGQADSVITKQADDMVVNTTSLTKNIRGYQGTTPVRIFIQKNKIVKIETLPNRETPKNLAMAKTMLDQFEGKSVKKAAKMQVDAVTGATYTSKSLLKNVKAGLEYYKQHK